MTKIIELAHALGEEIAKSEQIENLEVAKGKYESDATVQELMAEYQTQRTLLADEFKKGADADKDMLEKLKMRISELTKSIMENPVYTAFQAAQAALDALMEEVNSEIKFCITGERPEKCTHDCSTCSGCHG